MIGFPPSGTLPAVTAPAPEELRARIAQRVREQAKRRHVSLDRLAKEAGISRTALYNITSGRAAVTVDLLAKLGVALDVDPVAFLRPYRASTGRAGEARESAGSATQTEPPSAPQKRGRRGTRTAGKGRGGEPS